MNASVSILAEIPEELHQSLRSYLDTHPSWDQERVLAAAISLFLMRNDDSGRNYRTSANVYLETLYQHPLSG